MPNSDVILLINSAEGLLQLGLVLDGQVAAWRETPASGQGAEMLVPTLQQVLQTVRRSPDEITQIACVRGPGSFTGIRLALTTAFGLSRALARPDKGGPNTHGPAMAGVDYLPLLAATAQSEADGLCDGLAALWVLTHARRGQVNMQGFGKLGKPLTAPETLSLEEAITLIQNTANPETMPVGLVGSGLERNLPEINAALPAVLALPARLNQPSANAFCSLALIAEYSHEAIVPLYLRASDAEENLPGIAAGLGLDPEEAALALQRLQSRVDIL